jgi:V8-like Glu-specific endopeptidase
MEVKSVAEQLFFTTLRIDTINDSGNKGSGTGFICEHTYKDKRYPFIITNKHVVKNAVKGGISFIKKDADKPKLGDYFRIEIDDFENHWFGHEDSNVDIAICPLVPIEKHINDLGIEIFYATTSTSLMPYNIKMDEIDAIEDIIFIGYPNGIWDSKNYTPISRKGTTATPLNIDYEGQKKFLIDASVFGGSSGSPVFIYNSGVYATKNGPAMVGTKIYFVGVVASVYYKNEFNEIVSMPIPTDNKPMAVGKQMIDLGVVFKSNTVAEAIEQFVDKQA